MACDRLRIGPSSELPMKYVEIATAIRVMPTTVVTSTLRRSPS
jgi:hypothetical protein